MYFLLPHMIASIPGQGSLRGSLLTPIDSNKLIVLVRRQVSGGLGLSHREVKQGDGVTSRWGYSCGSREGLRMTLSGFH